MGQGLRTAVFLDRDGVLNCTWEWEGVTHPPATLDEFELLPGVVEATKRLVVAGWPLIVVTNQPDVARGLQTRQVVEAMHRLLHERLPLLDVLVCYHDAPDGCECRKPKPGLVLEAARRWHLDLHRSIIVGDRWSDVAAGQAAGCRAVLVATPWSGAERCRPDHTVRDLPEAAAWILTSFSRRGVA